jgi:hypothetical protein
MRLLASAGVALLLSDSPRASAGPNFKRTYGTYPPSTFTSVLGWDRTLKVVTAGDEDGDGKSVRLCTDGTKRDKSSGLCKDDMITACINDNDICNDDKKCKTLYFHRIRLYLKSLSAYISRRDRCPIKSDCQL